MFKFLIRYLLIRVKIFIIKFGNPSINIAGSIDLDWSTRVKTNNNKLSIGHGVYLRSNGNNYHAGMPFPTTILIDKDGAECFIGDHCRINGCYIHAQKKIIIGKNTVIAAGVNIIDSNGHVLNSSNRTIGRDEPQDIILGENVWVGLNVTILKNTIIGNNSVVAAGSVVKGIFAENVLIQGNPARVIKTLDI